MPSAYDLRSQPPEFHPEFGYFWPAAQTRRMMRIGLASTAIGALFGAVAVLAMTSPRPNPDAAPVETALMVASTESPASAEETGSALAVPAPTDAAPSSSPGPAAPVAAAKPCKEQTWPYLDSKCLSGALHQRHQVRIFRPETPAQSAPARILPPNSSEITAAQSSETPAATSRKRQKSAQTRERRRRDRGEASEGSRGRYADPRSAYAAPYGRYQPRYEWGGW